MTKPSEQRKGIAVLERVRKRFVAFASLPIRIGSPEEWSSAVESLKKAYPWVNTSFKRVLLSYRSKKFTMVPTRLFAPSLARQFLGTTAAIDDLDEIHYFSPTEGVTMAYAIPSQLTYAWKTLHDASAFIHADGAVVKTAIASKHKGTTLWLVAKGRFATIIIVRDGSLLAATPVTIFAAEDALYYCTAFLNSLGCGTEGIVLKIVGEGVSWPDDKDFRHTRRLPTAEIRGLLKRFYRVSDDPISPIGYEFSYIVEKVRAEASSLFLLAECV